MHKFIYIPFSVDVNVVMGLAARFGLKVINIADGYKLYGQPTLVNKFIAEEFSVQYETRVAKGSFKRDKIQARTYYFRLTKSMEDALFKLASAQGLTMSKFIIQVLQREIDKVE